MRIKYLGKSIIVKWRGTDKETLFAPYAEVSDELGTRLLANPELLGQFEEIKAKEYPCKECSFIGHTNAEIAVHFRTQHLPKKEKKSEKHSESVTVRKPRGRPFPKKSGAEQSGVSVESGSDLDGQGVPEGQLLVNNG